jgi:hypothetical protein
MRVYPDNMVELLVLADACRRAAAACITAIVPYFGYARADNRHGRLEPITGRMVADLQPRGPYPAFIKRSSTPAPYQARRWPRRLEQKSHRVLTRQFCLRVLMRSSTRNGARLPQKRKPPAGGSRALPCVAPGQYRDPAHDYGLWDSLLGWGSTQGSTPLPRAVFRRAARPGSRHD